MQQIAGVINLSIPVIAVFYMSPELLFHTFGPLGIAMLLGAYIWFLNYQQHKAGIARLLYSPTDSHKEKFDSWIRSCGLDSTRINLKYAYTAEQFAMTMGNTVIIDPICCSVCQNDSASAPVYTVFNQLIEPGLSSNAKKRIVAYKEMLPLQVQSFLFKHELGHVAARFAVQKLCIIFVSGTVAAYCGIMLAKALLLFNPYAAVLAGMVVGGLIDLSFAYVTNLLFKYPAEKQADLFAARYSSKEEIVAAAHFFEKLDEVRETYKDNDSFLKKLPSPLAFGYPTGKERCAYLLKIADRA